MVFTVAEILGPVKTMAKLPWTPMGPGFHCMFFLIVILWLASTDNMLRTVKETNRDRPPSMKTLQIDRDREDRSKRKQRE